MQRSHRQAKSTLTAFLLNDTVLIREPNRTEPENPVQKKRGSSVSFLRRRKNLPAGRVRVAEDAGPVTVDDLRLLAVAEDTSIGWLYFWTDRRRSRCGRQRVQMKQEAQECLAETSIRGRRVKLS
ncbi:hypothetical protein OPV22_019670 [Ensete ventricosum]|uniref:Uncharacterized protein n=1 Tax=Ensete ventricosum TaxID=4639 RepID=A0AAV8QIE1_ENSVE|nr:hypothetical protein OPV22_019670 [Ensete ventricosum]